MQQENLDAMLNLRCLNEQCSRTDLRTKFPFAQFCFLIQGINDWIESEDRAAHLR